MNKKFKKDRVFVAVLMFFQMYLSFHKFGHWLNETKDYIKSITLIR